MRQKSGTRHTASENVVKDIRRATRKQYSAEEKIHIVLDGLRGEETIAELCRREGIAQSLYYSWSKEFLEAGKKRLAGDTAFWVDDAATASLRGSNADRLKQQARESASREASPGQGFTPKRLRLFFASWSDGSISSALRKSAMAWSLSPFFSYV